MNKLIFQVASNILILWAMGLITYATIAIFSGDWSHVNGSLAAIYGSCTAILGTVTGYVQKRLSDIYRNEDSTRPTK